jgi:hypothetical protein
MKIGASEHRSAVPTFHLPSQRVVVVTDTLPRPADAQLRVASQTPESCGPGDKWGCCPAARPGPGFAWARRGGPHEVPMPVRRGVLVAADSTAIRIAVGATSRPPRWLHREASMTASAHGADSFESSWATSQIGGWPQPRTSQCGS